MINRSNSNNHNIPHHNKPRRAPTKTLPNNHNLSHLTHHLTKSDPRDTSESSDTNVPTEPTDLTEPNDTNDPTSGRSVTTDLTIGRTIAHTTDLTDTTSSGPVRL